MSAANCGRQCRGERKHHEIVCPHVHSLKRPTLNSQPCAAASAACWPPSPTVPLRSIGVCVSSVASSCSHAPRHPSWSSVECPALVGSAAAARPLPRSRCEAESGRIKERKKTNQTADRFGFGRPLRRHRRRVALPFEVRRSRRKRRESREGTSAVMDGRRRRALTRHMRCSALCVGSVCPSTAAARGALQLPFPFDHCTTLPTPGRQPPPCHCTELRASRSDCSEGQ